MRAARSAGTVLVWVLAVTNSHQFVLVVDNNQAHHNSIRNSLLRAGFQTLAVSNGVDAILKAKYKPAAVLVEANLPGRSGFDVCRVLKGDPDTRNVPVLMYSGMNQAGVVLLNEARQSGAGAFLSFPIQPEQLLAAMRTHAANAAHGD